MEDITARDLNNFESILDHLRLMSANGINADIESYFIGMLNMAIDFESYLIHEAEFPELHRMTINKRILKTNKRITDINHLKNPPENFVTSYGRCNKRHQSVLYASHGMLMVVSEMRPQVGDLVTISTWKSINEAKLTFSPIFYNQPPNGTFNLNSEYYTGLFENLINSYPPNIKAKIRSFTQFVADAFSKRFQHNANDVNYLLSAYFSDILLNKYQGGAVDAILYPSVQQSLSFENLAIKPTVFNSKYVLTSVKESIVMKTPRDGDSGFFQEGVAQCKNFDFDTDTILWDGKFSQSDDRIAEYIQYFGYEF